MRSNTKQALLVTVVGVTLFGAAAAFGRFGLCRAAGGSGAAHFGGRHSGVVPQRAHGRAGKAAGAAICQSEKAALGQGAPPC